MTTIDGFFKASTFLWLLDPSPEVLTGALRGQVKIREVH